MAYSFWVLVKSEKLPTPAATAQAIHISDFPLEIDADWDWKELMGWRPMLWNGRDSGCEIECERLGRKDAAAATKAGFPDLDTTLVITTRGSDSLRAASVFAGTVANASGGCVSERDGEYVRPDEVLDWMSSTLDAADSSDALEPQSGCPQELNKGDLVAVLGRLKGKVTKLVLVNSRLSMQLDDGCSFLGNSWKLRVADKVMVVSRWRTMMQIQTEILLGDGSDKECMEAADAMEADIAKAKALDQQDLDDAYAFLKSVNNLSVESARLVTPSSIEVALTGDTDSLLEFTTDIYLADFRASTDSTAARLSAPIPVP